MSFLATIFPSTIGYACSFNRSLTYEIAHVIATEARALGVSQLFAPVADLARELRFGRVEETYGEDPYLSGEISMEYTRALQQMNVSAMVKHFSAFSKPEGGLNTGPVDGGLRELRMTWLVSPKKAIVDGGAMAVMTSYNTYDGIPMVADPYTLIDILREEWGYEYMVMSDAGATDRMADQFYVCPLPLNSYNEPLTEGNMCIAEKTLTAGGDVEMGGGSFNYRAIPPLVEQGRMDVAHVDLAVSRVLRTKFALGLFEHPYRTAPQSEWENIINTPAAKELARQSDQESIVLMKNDAGILPVSGSAKVAVIGPFADAGASGERGTMNYGDYVVYRSQYMGVTPYAGITAAAEANGGSTTFARGAYQWSNDESMIPEAVSAAENADVAVVVVGTNSRDQQELWQGLNATTGEHVDVHDLNLVGAQRALAQAIVDTGKPTVIVFSSGKPVTETWISNTTASLLQQFYMGEEGGNALADILYGFANPSGKLSVSFPRDVGTLPVHYDFTNSGRGGLQPSTEGYGWIDDGQVYENGEIEFGHLYVLESPIPWFPFGHGLSYTNFTYSALELSGKDVSADATIHATVHVTNSGEVDGAEVVQLYVKDQLASVAVPNMQLRNFEKVMIPAGETAEVTMDIDVSELGIYDYRMNYVVEKGEFMVFAGSSSMDLRSNATFNVV